MDAKVNLIGNVVHHACKQFQISLDFNEFKILHSDIFRIMVIKITFYATQQRS